MSWPKSFMEKLMHHVRIVFIKSCDFDEESDEDLIER